MNLPYIYETYSVKKMMFFVLIASIPAILTECYFFGIVILIQILLFVLFSLLFEIIILKIRDKNIKENILDNSSVVTGVLLGLSIPCTLTWWMIMFSSFFAIVIAKHLYGGLGQNIFNPAMVGYAVLLISFPLYMSSWNKENTKFFSINNIKSSIDKIFFTTNNSDFLVDTDIENFTKATPLNNIKNHSHVSYDNALKNFISKNEKITIFSSWNYINLSFLLGGFFLLYKKIICWRIPFSFLFSLFFSSTINYLFSIDFIISPLFHLFSGGTMICAFFIATDPVTTSYSNIGKIVFGLIIGLLVYIIRNYSNYPDGVAFAVLFGNMLVPLIDNILKTSGYGHKNI
ncbi:RnfABCDGE type electron transport complex subunit D [Buchnera aphidicola (Aphis helianthi)]|uniref:Ion-translocating oxidoreductase complex subunit D n=1 Tax=Buchnera aphidicola (Aphis helianthi) TaxID=2315802 RepID=A0A4D6XQX2_9GAMM|nr:RnfABCDGE type electron transport complex subunit D [Buchnera aphidicola]QCI16950.1 RnfABCDGE type electron transport complex subunit D [Buchnera aphidicola (Aphis helianthi)]